MSVNDQHEFRPRHVKTVVARATGSWSGSRTRYRAKAYGETTETVLCCTRYGWSSEEAAAEAEAALSAELLRWVDGGE